MILIIHVIVMVNKLVLLFNFIIEKVRFSESPLLLQLYINSVIPIFGRFWVFHAA